MGCFGRHFVNCWSLPWPILWNYAHCKAYFLKTMSGQEACSVLEMKYGLSDNLQWQLFMQAALVNLFQQWIKWIWKTSISITQSSVQHVSLYIMCVGNKFSQFCVISLGVWNFAVLIVHTYIKILHNACFSCVGFAHFVVYSHASVVLVCICPLVYILWDSCAWPEVYICLIVSSCMSIYKRVKWGQKD